MSDDSELYRAFLKGSEAGFKTLVERYGDSLTLYLAAYTKNLQDAEDLMIEAFARIAQKKPSIADGAFKAYLYAAGRNLAANRHKALSRKGQPFSLEELEREPESGELIEELAQRSEQNRLLHRGLDRLDPELSEVLYLIYFEDMSYAAAAKIIGVKERRIEYLLQKGKTALREELEKEGLTDAHFG